VPLPQLLTTLSLHDALPILGGGVFDAAGHETGMGWGAAYRVRGGPGTAACRALAAGVHAQVCEPGTSPFQGFHDVAAAVAVAGEFNDDRQRTGGVLGGFQPGPDRVPVVAVEDDVVGVE